MTGKKRGESRRPLIELTKSRHGEPDFVQSLLVEFLDDGFVPSWAAVAPPEGWTAAAVAVLMDYAHNPAGFRGLVSFINKLPNKYRTVVLNGTGDRRDEDIIEMGVIAGENFDRIVIRRGNYLRGRTQENMVELLQEGVRRANPAAQVRVIPDSRDAIQHAVKNGRKGELVVTLADRVPDDIKYVQEIRDAMLEEQRLESEAKGES